MKLEFSPQI